MSGMDLKLCDLLEFSKMCAPEYNMPEFSDRILVFDVMQDGWETTRLVQSSDANELVQEMRSNDTAETSNGKRNLDSTDEGPQQKRKKIESDNSVETQVESLVADCGSEMENESAELACDQAECNRVDKPVISSPTEGLSEKSVVVDSNGIQENLSQPLRQHAIYVHSLWLAVQSPYFRSLLHSSGMKETHDKEVHLKIPESEEDSHLFLLEAMYRNDVLNDKTVDELLAVLELADKYDVKFVFKKCKYVLQENATTFEISTQIMHVIKVKHNMSDVEDLATTLQLVLAKEFSPLDENWQSEKFTNLSEPSLKYLMSSDDLIAQSENTVFHALIYWMEQNEIDPAGLEETNDLLAVVRFKLVTIDYLYNVINNHPIASKMPKFGELYLSGMTYHAIPSGQKKVLKVQPVLRKKPEGKIVQFTFVVGKEEYETLRSKKTELHSEEFWACGYKMSVGLIWECSWSYNLYPHLNVHNLNEESIVRLKFAILRQTDSNISWREETFDLNVCRKEYTSLNVANFSSSDDGTRVLYVVVKPF